MYSTAENWAVAVKNWASFPLVANVAALRWGCLGGPPSFDLSDSAPLQTRIVPAGHECAIRLISSCMAFFQVQVISRKKS